MEDFNILLIDDDDFFRKMFCKYFSLHYKIIDAPDGPTALKILKKHKKPDLIILDYIMPKMLGSDVFKKIKEIIPEVPVMVLTGYSSDYLSASQLKGQAEYFFEKSTAFSVLQLTIDKLFAAKNSNSSPKTGSIKTAIEKTKRFIEKNYNNKLCLKDAAKNVYLNEKYLSRIFKQVEGVGFNEYKMIIRVKKAKELLRDPLNSISDISDELGYENSESFSRIFKKQTNISPAQFRKQTVKVK